MNEQKQIIFENKNEDDKGIYFELSVDEDTERLIIKNSKGEKILSLTQGGILRVKENVLILDGSLD